MLLSNGEVMLLSFPIHFLKLSPTASSMSTAALSEFGQMLYGPVHFSHWWTLQTAGDGMSEQHECWHCLWGSQRSQEPQGHLGFL